jgi:acyl-CoA reductase-like NAD-dependent aldehyde dehydrogenase
MNIDTAPSSVLDRAAPRVLACFNPATGARLGEIPMATQADVAASVARAREVQPQWAASSFAQRRAVLADLMAQILANIDEICGAIVEDSGKTYENALLGEIMTVCAKIDWTRRYGERFLKPEKVKSGLLMHKKGWIEYRPLGVVACIVPWNYPFQNIYGSLIAPLMAGNAVIIKPSEVTAWSARFLGRFIRESLSRAGFPADIVQVIHGDGETGAALVRAGVQKILFIGSAPHGRRIVEGSAATLTPLIMELGGKDPFIVCEDADLAQAVPAVMGGCFINLGQNCVAAERIIVLDAIHDRFVEAVTREAGALRQGVPSAPGTVDVGAVTSPAQVSVIDTLVRDALARGARALVGGALPAGGGNFYPPTVLIDVTPQMRIAREEVFGPVMLIMRVASDAEAIALANATDYGLQATIMTRDAARARRIAAALECGGCAINDFGMCYLNQDLPFGGVKSSGFGRMNGRDGLRAYTNAKAMLADRFWFNVKANVFPVNPTDYAKARATVRLLFVRGWWQKSRALREMLRPPSTLPAHRPRQLP